MCLQLLDADLTHLEAAPFVGLVVLHPELPGTGRDRGEQTLNPFPDPFLVSLLLLLPVNFRLVLLCTRYGSSSSEW